MIPHISKIITPQKFRKAYQISCRQIVDDSPTYIITGNPIPLARPRFNGKVVFDSQRQKKQWIGQLVRSQHGARPMYKGALHLHITFFMRIPKYSKRKSALWHLTKPDLSNMIKFYEDICSGILYADDKQIVQITAAKKYDSKERTEFTITQLEGPMNSKDQRVEIQGQLDLQEEQS